jgi:hypothetical protein
MKALYAAPRVKPILTKLQQQKSTFFVEILIPNMGRHKGFPDFPSYEFEFVMASSLPQSYLSQLILKYAHKYISNIEANLNLALWGDIVLNNLDIRLDVLQRELRIPAAFQLSRGFVKELRVHIPWTALTWKPIEITLTRVEFLFEHCADSKDFSQSDDQEIFPSKKLPEPIIHADPTGTNLDDDEKQRGWGQELLLKILGNLSIVINDLVVSYRDGDNHMVFALGRGELTSADINWSTQAHFKRTGFKHDFDSLGFPPSWIFKVYQVVSSRITSLSSVEAGT